MMKGLSPGAALVMLMAGPAVNIASILVVKKSLGSRFTWIYLLTIVGFSVFFGLLVNAIGIGADIMPSCGIHDACCHSETVAPSVFQIICSTLLTLFIIIALTMKFLSKFKRQKVSSADMKVYTVEGMHCGHCKAAVEQAVGKLPGVTSAKATPAANMLVVTGTADESAIRKAVEQTGFHFKGRKE